MRSIFISVLLLFFFQNMSAQSPGPTFNLNFELNDDPTSIPNDWFQWGDFKTSSTSEVVQEGKWAGVIESIGTEGRFGSLAFGIPSKYTGEEILLEGYMKIENVQNGFAGLMLRLDGKNEPLGFDNMQNKQINGSHDWIKYSIALPFSDKVERIIVGGILVGSGKAWFDDFTVTIDGKTIQGMPLVEKPKAQAELDDEFRDGSKIELEQIDKEVENRLYLLCKVWGFLKYHHPDIAKGKHNWDNELFRILVYIKEDDFKNTLHEWVNNVGKIEKVTDKMETLNFGVLHLTDFKWIDDSKLLKSKTKSLLHKIRKAERDEDHYYVTTHVGVGNPKFTNEAVYRSMDCTDDGIRLLSLFRYWNMVEYYFPYKHLMDEEWDATLKSFIPRVVSDEAELEYKLTTLELIGKIQDTHANIWMRDAALSNFHGKFGPPIEIKWIENQWIITRIFEAFDQPDSKIKVGDIVTHIDDVKLEDLVAEKAKYCPASNLPTQMRDVAKRILRTNNTVVKLTLHNGKKSYSEEVNTILNEGINYWENDIPSHKFFGKNIGYIYPASLKEDEIHDIMDTFSKTKSIIIDLRCYPADFLVMKLGAYLLPEITPFAKFTKPIVSKPGHYNFTKPSVNGSENSDYYKGKIFILINEMTQSQAEYTTMALRNAPNAIVIGSTTAGADGNMTRFVLPGGIRTAFSGIGVYYPDGRETQRIGIIPDIKLKPTIKGIRKGKDEVLDLALEMSNWKF